MPKKNHLVIITKAIEKFLKNNPSEDSVRLLIISIFDF
jgi:hypothetical protein